MWQHNYEPIAGSLGMSTLVAAIPIVVLFLMLGVWRKPETAGASREKDAAAQEPVPQVAGAVR